MPRIIDDELMYRRGIEAEMDELNNPLESYISPRNINQDPTIVATSGKIGEVVHFSGSLYRKGVSNGRDKNWTKMA